MQSLLLTLYPFLDMTLSATQAVNWNKKNSLQRYIYLKVRLCHYCHGLTLTQYLGQG